MNRKELLVQLKKSYAYKQLRMAVAYHNCPKTRASRLGELTKMVLDNLVPSEIDKHDTIRGLFIWDYTPQGHKFWFRLDCNRPK